ncbi:MAG: hypothetical protein OEV76_12300, partial [Anaerolineae bacterium]|nr:hypothetical protein [Anaerolineae bacterium]
PNLQQAWSGLPMGGLIATTPFVALALAALPKHQATRVDRLLLAVFGGYVTLACLATPVDPGLQWGPRLLLPVYPAATILSLKGLQRVVREHKRPKKRTLVGVFLASSIVISLLFQGCSLRLLHVVKNRDRELIESTARLPTAWVISDEYGYAQYVAPLFFEKEFFYVRTQDDYQELAQRLLKNGITTYAVATYPTPHRRVVDPLDVGDGFVVRQIGDQLFEIETDKQTG